MDFTQAQEKIARDTHRFRVVVCGRKFGKTTLTSLELITRAIKDDQKRIIYIAPTLGDARRLMWDRLRNSFKSAVVKENDTRLEMRVKTTKDGESDIFLGSWELVNNYRGDEFDFIVFDEVQEYRNFWTGWQEAMRPTLTPRAGGALFTGTPKGFNHLYDLYNLEYKDNDFKSFKFTTYDNPYIPVDEIEKAKRELPDERFAQEYLAEFRKSEGLVFKEFSREAHVFDYEITGYSEFLAGVDFGYTNPTAIPSICLKDAKFYVTRELYRTGMTDDEVGDYIHNQRYNKVYPDPEAPAAIEVLRRKGINIREVKKGKDSIQHGIDQIRELFKQNKLFIHKSCINLINELEMYSYADSSPIRNENENPQDKYNHAIDALRYVVSTHVMEKPFIKRPFNDRMVEVWQGR
jgi:PBSX family phage terminase large subunit